MINRVDERVYVMCVKACAEHSDFSEYRWVPREPSLTLTQYAHNSNFF
jgi:hypothetical protein